MLKVLILNFKGRFLFTIAFICFVFLAFGQAPTAGLLAYYPLNGNGNTTDYSGNGYNGTLTNSPKGDTGCALCKPDSGIYFHQNGINCGSPSVFNLQGDATISLWVQFRAAGNQLLLCKDDGGGSNNKWMFMYDYNSPFNTFVFHINYSPSGPARWVYSGAFTPTLNICYHIVVTKQQNLVTGVGTYNFYVNSVNIGNSPAGSNTLPGNTPVIVSSMSIGELTPGFEGCNVNALMDRVRIYNRCLGQTGVDSLYNEKPKITMVPTADTAICAGTRIPIKAIGAPSYVWNNGATSSSISEAPVVDTTYVVKNTSIGTNCVSKDSVSITVNSSPTITVTPPSASLCSGNQVPLTANGAGATGTYSWKTGYALTSTSSANTTSTPTTTTTYTVIGNAANGCSDSTNVTVTVNSSPTITVTPPSPFLCSGNKVPLTANGAGATGTYSWKTGYALTSTSSANTTSTPTITTTYTVIGNASNGCSDSTNITVTVNSSPTITVTPPSASLCSGNQVPLTANGAGATGTYSWKTGYALTSTSSANTTSTPTTTTTYTVIGNASNGCSDSTNITVTVNPSPTIIVTPPSASICSGTPVPLTANGAGATGTYSWKTGYALTSTSSANTTSTPTLTTTYTVIGNASNGCNDSTNVTITVTPQIIPGISSAQTICSGKSVDLNATGGTGYMWLPNTNLSSNVIADPVASPTNNTKYVVTITDGPCTIKDSVTVNVNASPTDGICCGATITEGENTPVAVTPVTAGETYSWAPSGILSCPTCPNTLATPTVTSWVYVTVDNGTGCTIEDSVLITVKELCGAVYLPNAFSPNGDGNNDVLSLSGNCVEQMQLNIYDRWGNTVFATANPSSVWDGTYKGKPLNAGTFVYYLNVTTTDGQVINKKGNITLVR